MPAPLMDLTGERYGLLVVIDRAPNGPHRAQTRWNVRCDCGAEKAVDRTKLRSGETRSCGAPSHYTGEAARNWRGDAVSYSAAHYRLRVQRGSASLYECIACGQPAKDWAYQGGALDERTEVVRGHEVPYSLDPETYAPMCKGCHIRLDKR